MCITGQELCRAVGHMVGTGNEVLARWVYRLEFCRPKAETTAGRGRAVGGGRSDSWRPLPVVL